MATVPGEPSPSASSSAFAAGRYEEPVVHYEPGVSDHIVVGELGWLENVTDHPRLSPGAVTTPTVIAHDPETGEFETLNTLYKPLEET